MKVEDFEITWRHMVAVVVLGVVFGVGQYACNDWKAGIAHDAEAEQAVDAARDRIRDAAHVAGREDAEAFGDAEKSEE